MRDRRAKGRSRPDVLAKALKRRLVERYGETAPGRIAAEGALSALGVLLRKHPGIVLEMAAAGLLGAGRRSVEEAAAWREDRQSKRAADRPAAREEEPVERRPEPGRRGKRRNRWSKADRRRLLAAIRERSAARAPA